MLLERSVTIAREVRMAIVRSASALDAIRNAYEGEGDLVLTSLQIRRGQKELLETLAKQGGESQASVLRAIIDEWCESKLAMSNRVE